MLPPRIPSKSVLPRGHWGPPLRPLFLDDTSYEQLVGCTENIVRRLLVTDNYDSVSNFMRLYDSYENCRTPLFNLYRDFVPVVRAGSSTCVGLALELTRRLQCLERRFPGLKNAMGIMSCEESAPDVIRDCLRSDGPYQLDSPDKEHVLVGIQIYYYGRRGVLIADPGYHVPWIITVMMDRRYPHTGWFNHAMNSKQRRDFGYAYSCHNIHYIVWFDDELRQKEHTRSLSLIYVCRFFCDAICITEKRNLVYKLKSIIGRTHMGTVTAGLVLFLNPYFDQAKFTIIIGNRRIKHKFKDFQNEVDSEVLKTIETCNEILNLPEGKLISMIYRLVKILSDESFVRQCLQLSGYVQQCSILPREHDWATLWVKPSE